MQIARRATNELARAVSSDFGVARGNGASKGDENRIAEGRARCRRTSRSRTTVDGSDGSSSELGSREVKVMGCTCVSVI